MHGALGQKEEKYKMLFGLLAVLITKEGRAAMRRAGGSGSSLRYCFRATGPESFHDLLENGHVILIILDARYPNARLHILAVFEADRCASEKQTDKEAVELEKGMHIAVCERSWTEVQLPPDSLSGNVS
ncbi:MAG: hypothetical protein QM296_03080 [Bacillota bacterium]|nr:hypothetical protein [Bacillota bacterium]